VYLLSTLKNTLVTRWVFLFQKRSLQTLFDDKVKGLVEELLHVDDSGRFVVFISSIPPFLVVICFLQACCIHSFVIILLNVFYSVVWR
jgi:hypothetical protein